MKILWKTGINVVCPHVRCVCVWVSELAKLSGKVFCISIFGQHAQQPQQQREGREGGCCRSQVAQIVVTHAPQPKQTKAGRGKVEWKWGKTRTDRACVPCRGQKVSRGRVGAADFFFLKAQTKGKACSSHHPSMPPAYLFIRVFSKLNKQKEREGETVYGSERVREMKGKCISYLFALS